MIISYNKYINNFDTLKNNKFFIYKYIGYRMEIPQLLKTVVAAAVMAGSVYGFYEVTIAYFGSNVLSCL